MALVGVELETLVSEQDALTTRPTTSNSVYVSVILNMLHQSNEF